MNDSQNKNISDLSNTISEFKKSVDNGRIGGSVQVRLREFHNVSPYFKNNNRVIRRDFKDWGRYFKRFWKVGGMINEILNSTFWVLAKEAIGLGDVIIQAT